MGTAGAGPFRLLRRGRTAARAAGALSLLLWLSLAPSGQEQRPRPALPEGTVALRDVEYVPRGHERQKLDVYVPRSASAVPLVVWIHGGAWQGGSKERTKGI